MKRRQFLATMGAGVAGVVGYAHWVEPFWLDVTHRDLLIAGLPQSLDGRTLLHMSDLHIGESVRDTYLHRVWQTATALQPDLVMYTGDWVTWSGHQQIPQLESHLPLMPRGRIATVGVLGNHDYGSGWSEAYVADLVAERVTAAGITLLRNRSVDVSGLYVAGLDDLWARRGDPDRALATWTRDAPSLVLNHNPDQMDLWTQWRGYRGWVLSGHTHGGQCRSPFLPPPMLPVKNRRYTNGEIAVGDGRRVYISRGVGYTMQVRFDVRPEITLFTLRRA